jgi:transposase
MSKSMRYAPEVRERAVRLVLDHQGEHSSQWAAINSIAVKIGCTPETLRKWVRRAERDQGVRGGTTNSERERLRELERENREPKRSNEILRKASAYFARRSSTADPSDGVVYQRPQGKVRGRADLLALVGKSSVANYFSHIAILPC